MKCALNKVFKDRKACLPLHLLNIHYDNVSKLVHTATTTHRVNDRKCEKYEQKNKKYAKLP